MSRNYLTTLSLPVIQLYHNYKRCMRLKFNLDFCIVNREEWLLYVQYIGCKLLVRTNKQK